MKTDIYTLAHEIKNPLCVVKGYLEMMNEENCYKYKEIICNDINASLEILDNYLEYNKLDVVKDEIDLNLLLSDVEKSMKNYLSNRNVELDIRYLNDDIYLQADYSKLKEVFYNIIKNSVEWQSHLVNISYINKRKEIIITIQNDGEKMNNEALESLKDGLAYSVLGNGIGLSLSKKIIEMHGGKIEYHNNHNKGISTIITLNK